MSNEKKDEVRKFNIASNKFISSKDCANYSSVFTPDSDFMGKYAKYTKYEKLLKVDISGKWGMEESRCQ